jgi:hypothetical protein
MRQGTNPLREKPKNSMLRHSDPFALSKVNCIIFVARFISFFAPYDTRFTCHV